VLEVAVGAGQGLRAEGSEVFGDVAGGDEVAGFAGAAALKLIGG